VLRQALSGKADMTRLETLVLDHHREVMDDRKAVREHTDARFDRVEATLTQVKGMLGSRRREGSTA
jgi:hypothetical protein